MRSWEKKKNMAALRIPQISLIEGKLDVFIAE